MVARGTGEFLGKRLIKALVANVVTEERVIAVDVPAAYGKELWFASILSNLTPPQASQPISPNPSCRNAAGLNRLITSILCD